MFAKCADITMINAAVVMQRGGTRALNESGAAKKAVRKVR